MSGDRPRQRRRRLTEVVSDQVASWLPDLGQLLAVGAERLASPLARFDPERKAAAIDARLDAIRARLEAMAAGERPRRAEADLLAADLAAAATGLEQIGPRLPAVRRHTLAARLASYRRAVESLPPARGQRGSKPGQEAGVMAGTAALGWAVLQAAPTAAVGTGAGLAAMGGAATVVTLRNRLRRKDRRAAIGEALSAAEAGLPRLGELPVADLGRILRDQIRRARGSGRLSSGATALLVRIGERLDQLLVRAMTEDLDQDVVHLVRASITDYLPDTLDPFLALADPAARVGDRPAADEVAEQLAALDRALQAAAERPGRDRAAEHLLVQGEFLRAKFGPATDLDGRLDG